MLTKLVPAIEAKTNCNVVLHYAKEKDGAMKTGKTGYFEVSHEQLLSLAAQIYGRISDDSGSYVTCEDTIKTIKAVGLEFYEDYFVVDDEDYSPEQFISYLEESDENAEEFLGSLDQVPEYSAVVKFWEDKSVFAYFTGITVVTESDIEEDKLQPFKFK